MRFYKPPLAKIFFPEVVTKLKNDLYITIDDSPSDNTRRILDLLDEKGIKATFFSVGKNVLKYPDLQDEIIKRGHSVGIHSFFHKSAFKVSREFYLYDIKLASEIINTSLFRPPYGHLSIPVYKFLKKNYKIVLWSYMTYDFKGIDLIYEKKIQKGSIIVLHDNPAFYKVFEKQLTQIINIAHKKNLSFNTLNGI